MASEQVSSSVPAPLPTPQLQALQAWLARLGLSGKFLAIGGLVGVIAVFLPLLSMSMQMQMPSRSPAPARPFGEFVIRLLDHGARFCCRVGRAYSR